MNEEMFQLWIDLDASRMLASEYQVDPWNSQSPEVQRIWAELTDRKRLDDLLNWERSHSPLNPVAQRTVTKAIAQARSN